jgi:S-sulfosulfanyl-L-cysteine sulfohydrolase
MNPVVSVVEMTGKEIIKMLEENLERTFSENPMEQMGGYVKRCLGLYVKMRIENPKGSRIQEIYFGKEHLKKDKTFKVAFVTTQGVPEKYGSHRKELKIKSVQAMELFLKQNPDFKNIPYDTFCLV